MIKKSPLLVFIIIVVFYTNEAFTKTPPIGEEGVSFFIVDQKNADAYQSIQAAINASTSAKHAIILIHSGIYNEKLFITRNNLTLIGASAKNTVIEYAELRNNWRNDHTSDWGAAVINIAASDINIINLSVINNYGRLYNTDEHQFAIRSFENASRIILHQCNIIADGADTVSLWNKESGMYYHSYCHFEGHTDMVCPRGWALIENSSFFNKKKSATIWHDGERHQDQKLVVNNSHFDGIKGFWLGRHHYDAQFYLINSTFSNNLANTPIFRKTYSNTDKNKDNLYGERYFFFDNKANGNYPWIENNFNPKKTYLKNKSMEQWVFKNKWSPNQILSKLEKFIKTVQFESDKLTIN